MTNFEIICKAYETPEAIHKSNIITTIEEYGKDYSHCVIHTDLENIDMNYHMCLLARYCNQYKLFRGSKLIARSALI